MTEDRVDITNDDIRAARKDWLAATASEPDSARTAWLHDLYRRLISAQAQQIADDFRRGREDR
jgi:hypothetical protein